MVFVVRLTFWSNPDYIFDGLGSVVELCKDLLIWERGHVLVRPSVNTDVMSIDQSCEATI